jgi:ABC-type sugar transport system permease subunit
MTDTARRPAIGHSAPRAKPHMRWKRQAWAYGFILPAACAIAVAFGYPLVKVIRFSFQSGSVDDLTDVGFENYAWLWEDPVFVHSALNNL